MVLLPVYMFMKGEILIIILYFSLEVGSARDLPPNKYLKIVTNVLKQIWEAVKSWSLNWFLQEDIYQLIQPIAGLLTGLKWSSCTAMEDSTKGTIKSQHRTKMLSSISEVLITPDLISNGWCRLITYKLLNISCWRELQQVESLQLFGATISKVCLKILLPFQ